MTVTGCCSDHACRSKGGRPAMEVLETFEGTIASLFSRGWSYGRISAYMRQLTGRRRGLSCRNVRRFCRDRGMLLRPSIGAVELDQCIRSYILHVGHAYGRRTMQGLLRANGLVVSQARIAASLRRVAPLQYHARCVNTSRMLNPSPYQAFHYGQKLHLDQNEKIGRYGITRDCC